MIGGLLFLERKLTNVRNSSGKMGDSLVTALKVVLDTNRVAFFFQKLP